jgi:peptidoglycan/xylan/chitin deacetylase (PgdA/CDA1 family)
LTTAQIQEQVNLTQEALLAAGVGPIRLFRPPYGARNERVINAINLPLILWNMDPKDWKVKDAARVEASVQTDIHPGSIIVLHDTLPSTVEACRTIIANLKQAHYQFATISQLLKLPEDARGEYPR